MCNYKSCTKCRVDYSIDRFRERSDRNGKAYIVSYCIDCEREQKREAEKKRYKNFTVEQYKKHLDTARKSRQKESYKEWHRNWQKDRERKNQLYKLRRRVSALFRFSINAKDFKKSYSIFSCLDYSISDLREHLESQFEDWMNWDNWGVYKISEWSDKDPSTWTWQIDHIIPHSSFKYTSMEDEEFKKCWALDNLRPLSSKENIMKGSSLNHEK